MTETEAMDALLRRRWPDGPRCIHCDAPNPYRTTGRFVRFRCSSPACRKDYTLTTGTIMHGTHRPLWQWIVAERMLAEGSSKRAVADALDKDSNKVWLLCSKIQRNGGKLL